VGHRKTRREEPTPCIRCRFTRRWSACVKLWCAHSDGGLPAPLERVRLRVETAPVLPHVVPPEEASVCSEPPPSDAEGKLPVAKRRGRPPAVRVKEEDGESPAPGLVLGRKRTSGQIVEPGPPAKAKKGSAGTDGKRAAARGAAEAEPGRLKRRGSAAASVAVAGVSGYESEGNSEGAGGVAVQVSPSSSGQPLKRISSAAASTEAPAAAPMKGVRWCGCAVGAAPRIRVVPTSPAPPPLPSFVCRKNGKRRTGAVAVGQQPWLMPLLRRLHHRMLLWRLGVTATRRRCALLCFSNNPALRWTAALCGMHVLRCSPCALIIGFRLRHYALRLPASSSMRWLLYKTRRPCVPLPCVAHHMLASRAHLWCWGWEYGNMPSAPVPDNGEGGAA
jgi:hypothetical protein